MSPHHTSSFIDKRLLGVDIYIEKHLLMGVKVLEVMVFSIFDTEKVNIAHM